MDGPLRGLRSHEHRPPAHRDRRHGPDEGVGRTTVPIPDAAARSARARPSGDLPSEAQEPRAPAIRQRVDEVRSTAYGSHRAPVATALPVLRAGGAVRLSTPSSGASARLHTHNATPQPSGHRTTRTHQRTHNAEGSHRRRSHLLASSAERSVRHTGPTRRPVRQRHQQHAHPGGERSCYECSAKETTCSGWRTGPECTSAPSVAAPSDSTDSTPRRPHATAPSPHGER